MAMHNYHFSNGCSFSTKKKHNSCHQWLAIHHGIERENIINCAKGGRGNDRIVQTTMSFFYNNPERIKDTTASIGWSTPYRWDFILSDKQEGATVIRGANNDYDWQWQTFHLAKVDPPEPGRFFIKYGAERGMDLELTHAVKLYTQILTLQYFFKAHNIPYVMYHALTNDCPVDEVNGIERHQLKNLRNAIDKKHFFNFDPAESVHKKIKMQLANRSSPEHRYHHDEEYCQSHFEFVAKHGLGKAPNDAHPNQEGHRRWGELLYNFTKQNELFSN
jgi:hypothetical protein